MKIYKGYQVSISTYANNVIKHIARDGIGIVRFREMSQKKLYQAIDSLVLRKRKAIQLAKRRKAQAQRKKELAARKTRPTQRRKKLAAKRKKVVEKRQKQAKKSLKNTIASNKKSSKSSRPPKKKHFWG